MPENENFEKKYFRSTAEDSILPLGIKFKPLIAKIRLLEQKAFNDEDVENDIKAIKNRLIENAGKNSQEAQEEIKEKLNDLLNTILKRIKQECGHIDTFQKMNTALEISEEKNFKSDDKESWMQPARYNQNTKKIEINPLFNVKDDPLNILRSLATTNRGFSWPQVLHHELLHSEHTANNKKLSPTREIQTEDKTDPNRLFKDERILGETFAYYGSDRFASLLTTSEMKKILQPYGILENNEDYDRLIVAMRDIKRLYALDYTDKQIGELIQQAEWDPKTAAFNSLFKAIINTMNKKGINEEDLQEMVMAKDLKLKTYALKTRNIAQTEIKQCLSNLQKSTT